MVEAQAAEGRPKAGANCQTRCISSRSSGSFRSKSFGFDASFTNSALFMVIAATLITLFTLYAMRSRSLVPSRLQSVAELSYEFVANMVRDNVGTDGMKYFPFVFTLFMFVLVLNMLGMVPYSFTVTSHIIVTFALAAFIFLGVTLIGFWKHGVKFLKFFVPEGVPFVHAAAARGHRGDLLSDPAAQPVGAAVRQHDGRPHHAEGVRRLRRGARHSSAAGRRSASWWPSPASRSWSRSSRPTCSPSSLASTSTMRCTCIIEPVEFTFSLNP